MASRLEIVNQFNAAQQAGNAEAVSGLLTDDVVISVPMRGQVTGKQAAVQAMQQARAQASQFGIAWSEPSESEENVVMTASSPMGRLTQRFSFRDDKICKLEISMG